VCVYIYIYTQYISIIIMHNMIIPQLREKLIEKDQIFINDYINTIIYVYIIKNIRDNHVVHNN